MFVKMVFSGAVLCLFLAAVLVFATAPSSASGLAAGQNDRQAAAFSGAALFSNFQAGEYEIHELINRERRKKGLAELEWDGRLADLARAYSRKMSRESFFDHHDRSGKSVVERARDFKLNGWQKIGENLFFSEGYRNVPPLAVRGWMNSAEHRRNILDRDFTATGIGIARSRNGQIYITQVFIED